MAGLVPHRNTRAENIVGLLDRAVLFVAALVVASAAAAEPTWNEIDPDGTTCWDGSPWHFWYRAGAPDKLAIWFEGGGACWNDALCDVESRVPFDPKTRARPPANGVFDASRANNQIGRAHV